jgi:hypothetical protein
MYLITGVMDKKLFECNVNFFSFDILSNISFLHVLIDYMDVTYIKLDTFSFIYIYDVRDLTFS